jgi:hypothetical protein
MNDLLAHAADLVAIALVAMLIRFFVANVRRIGFHSLARCRANYSSCGHGAYYLGCHARA